MCNNQLWDLIITVCILYPVLAGIGAFLHAPMLLRTDIKSCNLFISLLKSFGVAEVFDLGKDPHQFESDVRGAFDDQILIFRYRQSRYISDNMQALMTFCIEETTSKEPQTLTVILSDRRVSPSVQDSVSGVVHPGELSDEYFPYYRGLWMALVNTILREQGWFLDRIGKDVGEDDDRSVPVFKAAAECLSLVYRQMRDDDPLREPLQSTVEDLDDLLTRIDDMWDGNSDPEYFKSIFGQGITDLFTSQPMESVKRLGECSLAMFESLDSLVFYDEDAYYFSERLFSAICSEILDDVDPEDIKEGLAEAGVLITEPRGGNYYYSKKVTIGLCDGKSERPRLMKFGRDDIDALCGDFTLFELIQIGKEGNKIDLY